MNGSPDAHHTLAIMHFNGSGGRRKDKDPEAGAALCARGNILFNSVPAKRELGHCLQDGFGVERDVALGKKLLAEAAAEDTQTPAIDIAVSAATAAAAAVEERLRKRNDINTLQEAVTASREVSNAARAAAREHLHATPENRFLLDWFNPDVCGEVLPPRHARVLAPAVRAGGDAKTRVSTVLVLRSRAVLLAELPVAGLAAAAQVRVLAAVGAVRVDGVGRGERGRRVRRSVAAGVPGRRGLWRGVVRGGGGGGVTSGGTATRAKPHGARRTSHARRGVSRGRARRQTLIITIIKAKREEAFFS